mmetsp:Transcript_21746/g.37239  ORF Transcript_21746/g.37239 Transcript_21746/m.37239 type:complete len:152 (-) Transcript_21746:169-624(-)
MSKITLLLACLACASSGWRVQVPGHHSQVIGTARTARRPTMQDDDFLVNLAKDPKNMMSDPNADPLFGGAAPAAAAPAAPSAAPGMAPGDDFLTELAKDPKNMLTAANTNADPLFGGPAPAAPAAAPASASSAAASLDGMTDEEKAAAVFR